MRLKTLLMTSASSAATSVIGAVASSGARSPWFVALDKPAFQPPPVTFPVVWTALYADIAVSSAAALDALEDQDDRARAFRAALVVNLVLNASWTWTFFRLKSLPVATTVAGVLALSSADLVLRVGRASRPAGAALAPYAVWCAFATVLSGAIWRRNR